MALTIGEGRRRGGKPNRCLIQPCSCNRSLRTPFFYLGSSWVNLVNDISFFRKPGLTCIQFKGNRNAPISWGEISWFFLKIWIFQGCFCNVIISTHWVTVDPRVEWTWIFSLRKLSCDQSVKKLHVLVLTAAGVCLIVLCCFKSDRCSVYRRGLCEAVSLRGQPSGQLPVLGWHWGPWQASEAKSC